MIKKIKSWFLNNNIIVNLQRYAAFCVSLYLTMDMFVLMVQGDAVKEWAFRAIAFVYESNKIMILKKSFVYKHRSARLLAIILMTVSVGMAAMSASQSAGTGYSASKMSAVMLAEIIADKSAQRDALIQKINALPAEWKTSSLEYQATVDKLQAEIDSTRAAMLESDSSAAAVGGVFETVGGMIGVSAAAVRFWMFFLLIVLIEAILYAETYYSAAQPEGLYTEEEMKEAVRATADRLRLATESSELF